MKNGNRQSKAAGTRKAGSRFMSGVLSIACLMTAVSAEGCKKKPKDDEVSLGYTDADVVSESYPYFTIEQIDLQIPLDNGKELGSAYYEEFRFLGDQVMMSYEIAYKTSPAEEAEMQRRYENGEQEAYWEWYEENHMYGQAIFDLEGNLISKTESFDEEDGQIVKVVENEKGERYAIAYQDDACFLKKMKDDGSLESGVQLSVGVPYDGDALLLPNGNLLVSSWDGLYLLGTDGQVIASGQNDEFQGCLFLQDGKCYGGCFHVDQKDFEKSSEYVQEIDQQTCEFTGEKISCPRVNSISKGANGNYRLNDNGIVKVDLLDKSKNQNFFSWNYTDFNHNSIQWNETRIESDESIYFLSCPEEIIGDGINGAVKIIQYPKLVHAVRAEKNPHAGKKIIRVGTYQCSILDFVIEYNLDPDSKCRIELHDYTTDQLEMDADTDLKKSATLSDKVYLDMISGNGPDILVGFSRFSQFSSDEVMVDLNPFIDATDDTGLDRGAYFDNIFRAGEIGGKLYHLPVLYALSGLVGNRDLVGDKTSWTYQEFLDMADTLPEDVTVLKETPYNELLSYLYSTESESFVDYGKKEVHFDSEGFRQLLEVAKRYGTAKSYSELWMEQGEGTPDEGTMFREDMLAFMYVYCGSLSSYAYQVHELDGKAVFCGWPNSKGGSMSAELQITMGISKFSKNQKEAWEILRFMISEEEQISMSDGENKSWMPVSRAALEQQNHTVRQANAESLENGGSEADYPYGMSTVLITDEVEKQMIKTIENVHCIVSTDPSVLNIVIEEAPGYFTGQRSIDDVCANIQNRTKTIVQER